MIRKELSSVSIKQYKILLNIMRLSLTDVFNRVLFLMLSVKSIIKVIKFNMFTGVHGRPA